MSANTVNLDRLFGSLNLANTIINGDFSGFELVYYTDTPSKDFTDALNESYFSDQSRGMRFLIQEWLPLKSYVASDATELSNRQQHCTHPENKRAYY